MANEHKDDHRDKEKPYLVVETVKSTEYEITFSEEVVHPAYQYAELCSMLREEVTKDDTVVLQISNYGGCCDSAATLVNAIKDCKGHVRAVVNAPSYSAATMLALAGDELELKPYSFLMFHNFSSSEKGKGGEIKMAVANTERVIHSMMSDLYFPFLSKAEINNIFNDKDVYVHWDDKELKERLARKFNSNEKE